MRWRGLGLFLGLVILAAFWLVGGPDQRRSGLGGIPQPLTGGEVVELELGEEGSGPSPVGEWLYVKTVGPDGARRPAAYEEALAEAARLPQEGGARWEHAGPLARGGRVADVAVTEDGTVFAAAASGGLWRSGDSGLVWERAWPDDLPQAMGAAASSPDGTLYAGTGDPVPTRAFAVSEGDGIYRSLDGGETWQHSGLPGSASIGRIAVDPRDPERVFAAAAGSLFSPGGERGLFRSTDGGESWELALEGGNPSTGAIDVAVAERNVLAAMWERDGDELGGAGSGVHLSTDGGDRWRQVELPGLPREVGRIGVAYSPADPDRAYAIVSSDLDGQAVGLWSSDDGGRTWRRTGASPDSLNQSLFGWWFGRLWPDPTDPDRLFVGGLHLSLSEDGGESFSVVALPPANSERPPINQHAMVWDPGQEGLVYLGTDSGMLRSVAGGRDGSWVAASKQGWTQLFSEAGPSWTTVDPALAAGPTSPRPDPYGTVTEVVEAPSDPDVAYMGTAEGALWRSEDAGATWERMVETDERDDLRPAWVTGIEVDRDDSDRLYVVFADAEPTQAGMRIVASSDGGSSWTEMTGNLPAAPINDLLALPGDGLAVASDVGVFVSDEPGVWRTLGAGLPRVPVIDLRLRGGAVTAATFGHGLQRLSLG